MFLGATAHVILLEATNSLANGSFDFSLGFHGEAPLDWSFRSSESPRLPHEPSRPVPNASPKVYQMRKKCRSPIAFPAQPHTIEAVGRRSEFDRGLAIEVVG